MLRRLALLSVAMSSAVLLLATQSATAVDTITIGGAIDGIGGGETRAVNALIGLDLKDASGQTLNADGTPRTASGYGIVVHINDGSAGQPNLPAEGTSDSATA